MCGLFLNCAELWLEVSGEKKDSGGHGRAFPAASWFLSSILGKSGCWDVLEVVDLHWERHPAMWSGLECFFLTLLLTSSLLQAPDNIRSAMVLDCVLLALVLGLD